MKIEFVIILFLTLISCKKEDPTPYPKTFPFECDGNYFVKLDSTHINFSSLFLFTLNNTNNFYALTRNYLLKINYNTLSIDSIYLNKITNLYDYSICPNKNIWIRHYEINTEFNREDKISLIDTLGNIIKSLSVEYADKMFATSDNGFIIVNNYYTSTIRKIVLSRYNESANLLWKKEYISNGIIRSLIETSSKDFIMCGKIFKNNNNDSYGYIAKFNQKGELLWEKNTENLTVIDNVIEQPLNYYVFATSAYNPSVFKIDSLGNFKWKIQLKNKYSFEKSLIKSKERDVIVCFSESNNAYNDFCMININNDGIVNWRKMYGGTGDEYFHKAFEIPNVGYYLIGTSTNYLGTGYWTDFYGDYWVNDCTIKNYFVKTDFNGESCK